MPAAVLAAGFILKSAVKSQFKSAVELALKSTSGKKFKPAI